MYSSMTDSSNSVMTPPPDLGVGTTRRHVVTCGARDESLELGHTVGATRHDQRVDHHGPDGHESRVSHFSI